MDFLKNNWAVLSLVFFAIFCEVGHIPFKNVAFRDDLTMDTPIYYLTSQIGLLNFWPALIIFLYIDRRNLASKSIAFGLVVWNIKEVIDELAYFINGNTNVFEINKSFWAQVAFILAVVSFSAFGFYRWRRSKER